MSEPYFTLGLILTLAMPISPGFYWLYVLYKEQKELDALEAAGHKRKKKKKKH